MTLLDRFTEKWEENGSGCWVWTASTAGDGYAQFHYKIGGYGHRFAYEHYIGEIPVGMEIDHVCRNRRCVNPDHLELVTHAENMRRGFISRTHCHRGHEYTPENTRMEGRKRRCLTCKRERRAA